MKLTDRIRQHVDYCKKRLDKLLERYPEPPKEKITGYQKDDRYYWMITDENGVRRHLSVKEHARAVRIALAQVRYLEILDLKCDLEACRRYLNYVNRYGGKLEKFLSGANDAFKSLIHDSFHTENDRVKAWADAPYEKSTYHPEQLLIATSQGFKVRSKSEALIAEVLFLLGLPCRYEEVIYLNGERLVPDFVVLNPITMKVFYIEYNGMMDKPEYVERYLHKAGLYIRCGIIPDVDMLHFYETEDCKIDMRQIRFRIENFVYGDAA